MSAPQSTVRYAPAPAPAVLLNPGPVNVHPDVRAALGFPDVCHREPEVAALIDRIRAKVVAVCGGGPEHRGVLLTGSGTAALEATLGSIVPPDGKVLVLENGHYGVRLAEIATALGLPLRRLAFAWASPLDLAAIEATLAADRSITHVAMVHHETSTGMLNPLREIGEICRRHGASLAVDAISSLGSEALDVRLDGVDWCVGTANKCLEGLPGMSFVCAPEPLLRGLAGWPPRGYYLDLSRHFLAQEDLGAPAFTPAVQIAFAFERALDLTLAETVTARTARYARRAEELRAGLADLGFRPLLESGEASGAVTVSHLPDGVTYEHLHDALKAAGFVVYATQARLGATVRIGTMGQLTEADIARFLAALREALPAPARVDRPA
ncbi:MAG TPA: 2-aminoethylphosphonate aminotransferase [Solirubrobacterales bacterium]|nr:2-aminoethylphosphonate aminotransferase [Solirubrobacterales bacterium]